MDGSQKGWRPHGLGPAAWPRCLATCSSSREKRKGLTNQAEGEDGENDEEETKPSKATAKITAAADEAEVLSDLGQSKNKELAAKRVVKMITVLKSVKADLASGASGPQATSQQKAVQDCLVDLQKLSKKGPKLSMEAAKDGLLEAALCVKRIQKAKKS